MELFMSWTHKFKTTFCTVSPNVCGSASTDLIACHPVGA